MNRGLRGGRREPRGHWLLAGLFSVLFCVTLFLHGYATHQIGHSNTPGAVTGASADLGADDSLLDLEPARVPDRSSRRRARWR